MEYWNHGEQTKVAKLTGIRRQKLNDVLHRRRSVRKGTALKLYFAAKMVTKREIPWQAWLFNAETSHPAFFGKPIDSNV